LLEKKCRNNGLKPKSFTPSYLLSMREPVG